MLYICCFLNASKGYVCQSANYLFPLPTGPVVSAPKSALDGVRFPDSLQGY